MVAYSFRPQFIEPIVGRSKCQTIRAHRHRHARVGERIQIYAGMRTRHCRKLIPDPVCHDVCAVTIDLRDGNESRIIIADQRPIPAGAPEADEFACSDGFAAEGGMRPIDVMLRWWRDTHGEIIFHGVLIRWTCVDDALVFPVPLTDCSRMEAS
jgi:hypothetical protein